MNRPLSDVEVISLCNGLKLGSRIGTNRFSFFTYDDLATQTYPRPNCGYIILFRENPNFGHFCCLINHNGILEFFDSYGLKPDRELDWNSARINRQLCQDKPYLSRIMRSFPGKLEYNEHHLHGDGEHDQTCGRWCGMRCLLSGMSLLQFVKVIHYLSKGIHVTPSELITILSNNVLY